MKKFFRTDLLGVAAIFLTALLATFVLYGYEQRRELQRAETEFQVLSDTVVRDLRNTMQAYGLFLRGGVNYFRFSGSVTRDDWRSYVENLNLSANYPGVQGVSFNAILKDRPAVTEFENRIRSTDWDNFSVRPDGDRDLYAPVLYLEPLNSRNEQALGFDIYSEDNRRTAVDRSISTGEPAVTAKITLVQENAESGSQDVQAGILVILPVFARGQDATSATARLEAAEGLIVSVFRMGDLVESILQKQGIEAQSLMAVHLYDSPFADAEQSMFEDVRLTDGTITDAQFATSTTFEVFGRNWTLQARSTPEFENLVVTTGSRIIAFAGVIFSLLLTAFVYAQSARTRDSIITARKLHDNKEHIHMLMAEVNHRSKNLLSLVQAIARQTSRTDSNEFVETFGRRLNALAASQDLLVKNEWRSISLDRLVSSQLAHFSEILDDRIKTSGPAVEITPSAAQTIGMAIYELGTNAGKYGSLSNDTGLVNIRWDVNKSDEFEMSWTETGGPAVNEPTRKGFGSRVTGVVTELSLEGKVNVSYDKTGFRWTLTCPRGKISPHNDGPSLRVVA